MNSSIYPSAVRTAEEGCTSGTLRNISKFIAAINERKQIKNEIEKLFILEQSNELQPTTRSHRRGFVARRNPTTFLRIDHTENGVEFETEIYNFSGAINKIREFGGGLKFTICDYCIK